jgi:hypothetical protein
VRTYVNGTLYSVLVRASLKERAQELGLADSLGTAAAVHKGRPRQMRRQMRRHGARPTGREREPMRTHNNLASPHGLMTQQT